MPAPILYGPDYLALPRPETPWLVHSLIPRDGALLLYSAPKQGKSTALLQLASAISNPAVSHFLGLPILTHGPVGYLQLDTPSGLWISEYVAPMSEQASFDAVAFHDRDTMPAGHYPFNIRNAHHALWLRAWVSAFNPVCVIVDTLRELYRGEERDSDLAQMMMSALYTALTPAAIVLVHHSRKIDPQRPAEHVSEDARGTTYITGKVDVICQFTRRRWKIQGRGGDMTLKTTRDRDTGLIHLDGVHLQLVQNTILNPTFNSDRDRARVIAEQMGITVEAARYRIKEARSHLALKV